MRRRIVLAMVASGVLAGAACHHRVAPAVSPAPPVPAPAVPRTPPPPPAPRASAPAPAAPLSDDELFRRKSLDELNAEHPLADAFFDYDQNVLRDDAKAALQKDATWLARWPQTRIVIEGHCDERGTPEYNLALGERRAAAVREYLSNLGVDPGRVATRSLGKEAPFCHEDAEGCWSQNRRGHFLITAK